MRQLCTLLNATLRLAEGGNPMQLSLKKKHILARPLLKPVAFSPNCRTTSVPLGIMHPYKQYIIFVEEGKLMVLGKLLYKLSTEREFFKICNYKR